jgi:hypothetical protein
MATGACDIERCKKRATYDIETMIDYSLCAQHEQEWRNSGKRLRTNPKKHTLRLIEVVAPSD